jgi:hypothetical protein
LPRTSLGRVDRRALPTDLPAEPESPYVAPRTLTEVRLTAMWAALLHRDKVGREDDFFALGGDSLVAARLAGRVRTTFAVELSVCEVFRAPSAALLAELIDSRRSPEANPGPTTSDDGPASAVDQFRFPTTYAQRRLWRLHQLDTHSPDHVLVQAHHLRGILDERALDAALQDLVARHETLRTSFTAADGVPMQVVVSGARVPLQVTDLRQEPEDARLAMAHQAAVAETARRFDLDRGPLLRARLLRLAPEEHVLVLAIHHIVSDELSLGVLSRELGQCYGAHLVGEAPQLAELPVQYADYAIWQHEWLSGAALSGELGYWRERLAGAPSQLRLTADQQPASSHRGARESLTLGPALTDAVRALSRGGGATVFMTLLGGFGVLLSRYSGQLDMVVGSPVGGRTRSELEGLIGCFVNTLPLRLDLRGSPSFRELLDRVRQEVLGAYAHQEFPFERLVEELRLEHHSASRIVFGQGDGSPARPRLSGLEVHPLPLERPALWFDFALVVEEVEGGLHCECNYRPDLFGGETIRCLLQQYGSLLKQVAENPDRRIDESFPSLQLPHASGYLAGPSGR